jgi:hypothetical protein
VLEGIVWDHATKHFVESNKSTKGMICLLYLFDDHKVVSIAGYRIYSILYCGKMLYIDDLSTLESARGKDMPVLF